MDSHEFSPNSRLEKTIPYPLKEVDDGSAWRSTRDTAKYRYSKSSRFSYNVPVTIQEGDCGLGKENIQDFEDLMVCLKWKSLEI